MQGLALILALAGVTVMGSASPVSAAQEGCREARAWPSFAQVAPTARSIYLVRVTESVDGVALEGNLVTVMKGSAPPTVDLRTLQPGTTGNGCPAPIGPYARVGDRLLIAYDGTAPDRVGSIDAVARVGRFRHRSNPSRLERLTFEEAQAWDASEPEVDDEPTARPALDPSVPLPGEPLWSCGGDPPGFPRQVLDGPVGVEQLPGAVFHGLRTSLELMRPEFELNPREDRPHELPWLLAVYDEDLALFLVQRPGGTEHYSAMYVDRKGDEWGFGGYRGDCQLRPLITHGLGSSEWRVDAWSPPTPQSTSFPVEVMEHECASGQPADGRIAEPIVEYGEDAITVTIPVHEVEGGATCPGNPWTPFLLELDEPIGDRQLLDGGPWPPEPRWPLP
jgi:hypothetical protein